MTAPTMAARPHVPVSAPAVGGERVERLASHAAQAAAVRALATHPDVIALRVERVRAQVDALLWAGIVLGLAFTMVNVQTFAATGSPRFTAGWWVAWLLDPMVSLVLLAVLRAEQVTARYQVALPEWGRRTKWLTFAATYVMNTWTSWGFAGTPFTAAGVVLHSVPPLVVFATAETGPGLRDRLTEAVNRALTENQHGAHARTDGLPLARFPVVPATPIGSVRESAGTAAVPVDTNAGSPVTGGIHELPGNAPPPGESAAVAATDGPRPSRRPARRPQQRRKAPVGRRLLGEYVADARTALDRARSAGEAVEPTPAWCRRVTGCSAGTSVKVAAALREPTTSTTSTSTSPVRSARREEAA